MLVAVCSVQHGAELEYLWRDMSALQPPTGSAADVALSRNLLEYFLNFARAGDPNGTPPPPPKPTGHDSMPMSALQPAVRKPRVFSSISDHPSRYSLGSLVGAGITVLAPIRARSAWRRDDAARCRREARTGFGAQCGRV
eukprot:SAG11_NODE_949_length_6408_cov_16.986210_5_plen_140_part_00